MLNPISLLVWNIRGASRSDSLRYLKKLCSENSIQILVLLEPMSDSGHIENVKRRLNFDHVACFVEGKI